MKNQKRIKKLIASSLLISLLLTSSCYAIPTLTKEETVYVNLDNYGAVEQINIYTKSKTNGESSIVDNTAYTDITNLTNREKYIASGDSIIWNVEGEENFSYTGKVNEKYYNLIPWNFDISYKVNGVEVNENELLGASGLIEITIDINANENADEYYKNNYILEITGSYDMSEYLSINSAEAMITNTGNTNTLMFIVLPGQSTTLHIEIGSNSFEMDGITMAMVPLSGTILEKLSDMVNEKNDIEDSLDAINVSTDIILNSLGGMTTGLNELSNGINNIKSGTEEMHLLQNARDEDTAKIKEILIDISPIISDSKTDIDNLIKHYQNFIEMSNELNIDMKDILEELDSLNENLDELYEVIKYLPSNTTDIKDTIEDLEDLTNNLRDMLSTLDSVSSDSISKIEKILTSIGIEVKNIGSSLSGITVTDESTLESVTEIATSAGKIGNTLENMQTLLVGMNDFLKDLKSDSSSTQKTLKHLSNDLVNINDMLDKNDAKIVVETFEDIQSLTYTLTKSLNTVDKYNDEFLESSGDVLVALDNVKLLLNELEKMDMTCISITTNLQSVFNILSTKLYTGTTETLEALNLVSMQLNKISSQSNTLINSKNTIKTIIDDKSDEIENKTTIFNIDKDAKVVSFGSKENENIDKVQFLLKTPDIKNIKEKIEDPEKKTEKLTFWERIVFIFKKMFGWLFKD